MSINLFIMWFKISLSYLHVATNNREETCYDVSLLIESISDKEGTY